MTAELSGWAQGIILLSVLLQCLACFLGNSRDLHKRLNIAVGPDQTNFKNNNKREGEGL